MDQILNFVEILFTILLEVQEFAVQWTSRHDGRAVAPQFPGELVDGLFVKVLRGLERAKLALDSAERIRANPDVQALYLDRRPHG